MNTNTNTRATIIKQNGIFSVEFYTSENDVITSKSEQKAMQQFFKAYPAGDLACRPSTLLAMPSRDIARAHCRAFPSRRVIDFGKHNQKARWFVAKK